MFYFRRNLKDDGFVYIWETSHAVAEYFLCKPRPRSCHRQKPRLPTIKLFFLFFSSTHNVYIKEAGPIHAVEAKLERRGGEESIHGTASCRRIYLKSAPPRRWWFESSASSEAPAQWNSPGLHSRSTSGLDGGGPSHAATIQPESEVRVNFKEPVWRCACVWNDRCHYRASRVKLAAVLGSELLYAEPVTNTRLLRIPNGAESRWCRRAVEPPADGRRGTEEVAPQPSVVFGHYVANQLPRVSWARRPAPLWNIPKNNANRTRARRGLGSWRCPQFAVLWWNFSSACAASF